MVEAAVRMGFAEAPTLPVEDDNVTVGAVSTAVVSVILPEPLAVREMLLEAVRLIAPREMEPLLAVLCRVILAALEMAAPRVMLLLSSNWKVALEEEAFSVTAPLLVI